MVRVKTPGNSHDTTWSLEGEKSEGPLPIFRPGPQKVLLRHWYWIRKLRNHFEPVLDRKYWLILSAFFQPCLSKAGRWDYQFSSLAIQDPLDALQFTLKIESKARATPDIFSPEYPSFYEGSLQDPWSRKFSRPLTSQKISNAVWPAKRYDEVKRWTFRYLCRIVSRFKLNRDSRRTLARNVYA